MDPCHPTLREICTGSNVFAFHSLSEGLKLKARIPEAVTLIRVPTLRIRNVSGIRLALSVDRTAASSVSTAKEENYGE